MVDFEAMMCGVLFAMYWNSVFSSVFDISEMGLCDVPMFMCLVLELV